jgi:PncC family amidohydrolase
MAAGKPLATYPAMTVDAPGGTAEGSGPRDSAATVAAIAERLRARHETLAVAESACGGLLSHLLTNLPGSSAWFAGGVVAYSNQAKLALLGIPQDVLATAGAVSPTCALAMARGAQARLGTHWGIAETGIAGPQAGRRSAKPAGLAYIALYGPGIERVTEVQTGRDERVANKEAFARAALELLLAALAGG